MELTSKKYGQNNEWHRTYEVKLAERNGKFYVDQKVYWKDEFVKFGATGAKFTMVEAMQKAHEACNKCEALPQ